MALRLFGMGAVAGAALLTVSASPADAGEQTSASGPKSVDLRTAPVLQSRPMPPIDFNRRMPPADYLIDKQRGTARTQETPPDKTGGGR